jgi:checkpoint serine/threonine-protein kinase
MNGVGTMVADLYIAWSHYYDAADDFKQTEAIFCKGLDAGAQPYEELAQAHQNFKVSMSIRILYNDEESKAKFQETMEQKRGALTRLRAHKKKNVPSVRTGFSVLNENPGRFEAAGESSRSQVPVVVHEDDGSQAGTSTSIMKRNIVDGIKKKNENFLEPGAWSKVKLKTGVATGPLTPGFEIMEDDNMLPPIKYDNKLYELGAQLPAGFISCNKLQKSSEEYAMIVEEPIAPNSIPCYEKFSIYPNEKTEISPEELRGFRWFVKKGNFSAPVVEKYSELLINKFECAPRLFPGYARESVKNDQEVKYPTEIEPYVAEHIQLPIMKMYEGQYEIKSMEELLADKFNRGQIKLMDVSDFEEDVSDMELTMVHECRQSIHPLARKSFVPRKSILRKSMMPKTPISEDEEVQEKPKTVRFEEVKEIEGKFKYLFFIFS